jgi:HEAT repeat protein
MKSIQLFLTTILVGLPLCASPTLAWLGLPNPLYEAAEGISSRSTAYRDAQRALDLGDWSGAEQRFGQIATESGPDSDAALYWQAWAQHKSGRSTLALQNLKILESRYPESSWIDDARALQIEIDTRPVSEWSEEDTDEELKLYALNSLLMADPDRALPILEKYLRGDYSARLKERAMFVLSQSHSPEAHALLAELAISSSDPRTAMAAIEFMGLDDSPETANRLREIYEATDDKQVKSRILEALSLGEHRELILTAAREEQDPQLRGKAIELLGVMDAVPELQQLYTDETSVQLKVRILEALFLADDTQTLLEVAQGESDTALRMKAIEGLALIDSTETSEALSSLYESSSAIEVKSKIVEAYMLQNNTEALINVVRTEQDPRLRRQALETLSLMDSEVAEEFMIEILEQ